MCEVGLGGTCGDFYSECDEKGVIVDQVRVLRHCAAWGRVNQEWPWETRQKANTTGQSSRGTNDFCYGLTWA